MSINFQDGFFQGATVRGVPLTQSHPGKIFWVNNSTVLGKGAVGGSDSGLGTFTRPFSTIDYAIGRCTASRGDIIAVMPGHAESLSEASAITLDVAGVAIVGLGYGSLRPQLTLDTAATATMVVSAANCTLHNLQFVAGFADIATGLSVSAAGTGLSVESCWFTEGGTNLNWILTVTLTTLCHDVSFRNCDFRSVDTAQTSFISGTAHNGLYIEGCRFYQAAAQASVTALIVATDVTAGLIKDCAFRSLVDGAKFIGLSGTCTGVARNNYFSSIDTAGAQTGGYVGSGFLSFENYTSGEADGWGLIMGDTAVYS